MTGLRTWNSGGDPASGPTLGTPATVESESAFVRQHCFLLSLSMLRRNDFASTVPENAVCTADAVCRSTRRLRSLHDRRTGPLPSWLARAADCPSFPLYLAAIRGC